MNSKCLQGQVNWRRHACHKCWIHPPEITYELPQGRRVYNFITWGTFNMQFCSRVNNAGKTNIFPKLFFLHGMFSLILHSLSVIVDRLANLRMLLLSTFQSRTLLDLHIRVFIVTFSEMAHHLLTLPFAIEHLFIFSVTLFVFGLQELKPIPADLDIS